MDRHAAGQEGKQYATDLDETEGLIRTVMVEQKAEKSRASLPDLAPVDHENSAGGDSRPRLRRTYNAPRRRSGLSPQHLKQKLLTYRPKRTHVAWALVLIVVVWRPWLIPGALFVSFWVGLIIYLTVGSDRFMEWMSSCWYRLVSANPALAEKMRARADSFALRFDAMLDRLPESWAEKLALPDFSARRAEQEELDERPDPFDRLKTPEVYRG